MSASNSPTRAPSWESPAARLTATVDFPTPPLPEETALALLALRHADVVRHVLRQQAKGVARFALVVEDDRLALVAARPNRGIERDPSQVWEFVLLGKGLPATLAEDLVLTATVRTDEAAHVLCNTQDDGVVATEHP